MDALLKFISTTYLGGILLIILGAYTIFSVKKTPDTPENAWFAGNLKGTIAGYAFVLLGLTVVVSKLLGRV